MQQSAIWAAYGDALGFITELADEGRVLHRTGSRAIVRTVPWRRKLGSKIGVYVDFPAGTYSDDTQLRLATSRAIRADGSFDVAAFSKVELPAWNNYALGAGLASREAAANLSRTSATWYSNFFSNKRTQYINAGGNGGAMRIQPHVWAAKDLRNLRPIYRDVVKNTICTHGHPRAVVGACFHAMSLAFAMQTGHPADLEQLYMGLDTLDELSVVIEDDADLRLFWAGPWTDQLNTTLESALKSAIDELRDDIRSLRHASSANAEQSYLESLRIIGGLDPQTRGSGTKTALLASYLSAVCTESGPEGAIILAANALGSDTDSIATMAGAILGACSADDLTHPLQDIDYIVFEAQRLASSSNGTAQRSFGYPDLRKWRPERAAVDAIVRSDDGLALNGIARAEMTAEPTVHESDGIFLGWLRLSFGQTILARIRETPNYVKDISERVVMHRVTPQMPSQRTPPAANLPDLFGDRADRQSETPAPREEDLSRLTLSGLLTKIIDSNFDPHLIGLAILAQTQDDRDDHVERSVALTANVVTAFRARKRKRR